MSGWYFIGRALRRRRQVDRVWLREQVKARRERCVERMNECRDIAAAPNAGPRQYARWTNRAMRFDARIQELDFVLDLLREES